jgi:phthiocerol/phenolphthiocerol synthesis type-I polyketide synthase C
VLGRAFSPTAKPYSLLAGPTSLDLSILPNKCGRCLCRGGTLSVGVPPHLKIANCASQESELHEVHRSRHSTYVDVLQTRADQSPGRLAYTFLPDNQSTELRLTYKELDRAAKAISSALQDLGLAGERSLLLYPPGLEYIMAFFGCLYAGVIPVPAYPLRANRSVGRLRSIIRESNPKAAFFVGRSGSLDSSSPEADEPELSHLIPLHLSELLKADPDNWRPPSISSNSLALLQFTSGSTASPKGVMVTHGNLLFNAACIESAFEASPESHCVIWLPPYHDMGLMGGILQPLYSGFPVTLMSPSAFLQWPLRWLRTISETRAALSGGPCFAYELCAHAATANYLAELDLSCWRTAFCGSEPIRPEMLDRFVATFGRCGFRREAFFSCYGLAESTLFVSGGRAHTTPVLGCFDSAGLSKHEVIESNIGAAESKTLVSSGPQIIDGVAIVDPKTKTRSALGQVGEIWIANPSVTKGYWNRPAETEETFGARIGGSDEGPFLRTGDLGFIHNGELFVTGRSKELIILRGRNHYPVDLEITARESHSALHAAIGVAFAVELDGRERLVIVHEVERSHRRDDPDEILRAIRKAIAVEHGIEPSAILLTGPLRIPRTSSGKLQRSACKEAWLANTLPVLRRWDDFEAVQPANARAEGSGRDRVAGASASLALPSKHASWTAIESWMISRIASATAVSPTDIDRHAPFQSLGLDSVRTVSLSGELSNWLNRPLSPTLFWDWPTIASLSAHLAGDSPSTYADRQGQVPVVRASEGRDSIAIVGIGNRFPNANSSAQFWENLSEGADAVGQVPADRWKSSSSAEDLSAHGGFITDVDLFDPAFFRISPKEAVRMDPQQRLLLEVAWEALENAGLISAALAGSQGGVFVGVSNSDYSHFQIGHPELLNAYSGTGNALSIAANRISYVLGLHGPSLSIDTACSSSLAAVHLACSSLKRFECSFAIVGGVNLILRPDLTITFSKAQMMSRSGRCRTFDASADGYVRGEGCGVVVLKRLEDANRDGDRVLAVIRGSALNHDGRSNGLTAPSGIAQEAVITAALRDAGVSAEEVSYVEAHGTGTPLGDPIEIRALSKAYGCVREQPLPVGSVKTNVGHLEAAAGIAGLIKVVLSLQHQQLPAHLHWREPNPHINWAGAGVRVVREREPWMPVRGKRIAGISSFGFGGTNAHVIVEEAPAVAARGAVEMERPVHLMTVSGRTEASARELAERYADTLESAESEVGDIAYTCNAGRSHWEHRLAVTGATGQELAAGLRASLPRLVERDGEHRIGFLFTGQGSQYIGMGRELFETEPGFRRTLQQCEQILDGALETPLLNLLYGSGSEEQLQQTCCAQPALFALEYALAELWRRWGLEPAVVLGHSVGEYVAATVAGVFDLESGLRLIAARGRLMQSLPQVGGMAAVSAGQERVQRAISSYADRLSVAAVNGSADTVISGERGALKSVFRELREEGIRVRELAVSHAFHSPLMEPMMAEFAELAAAVAYRLPTIPLVSNVSGEVVRDGAMSHAGYWTRHIREQVRFAAGMRCLESEGCTEFLEAGPKPVLLGMGRSALSSDQGQAWLPSLRPGISDWRQMLDSAVELYTRGVNLDWKAFDQPYGRRRIAIPTYPFQRQRYWLDEAPPKSVPPRDTLHPLLGRRLSSALSAIQFESDLTSTDPSYLADHVVRGELLFPMAGYVEMALSSAHHGLTYERPLVSDLRVEHPLRLSEAVSTRIQTILTPASAGEMDLSIYFADGARDHQWIKVASAKIVDASAEFGGPVDLAALRRRCSTVVAIESQYEELRAAGLEYGPSFQAMTALMAGSGEALATVCLPKGLTGDTALYCIHPVLLDACFHALSAAVEDTQLGAFVPVAIDRYAQGSWQGTEVHVHVRVRSSVPSPRMTADFTLFDLEGSVIAEITGMQLVKMSQSNPEQKLGHLFRIEWQPLALRELTRPSTSGPAQGTWLILADRDGCGEAVAGQLQAAGGNCHLLYAQTEDLPTALESALVLVQTKNCRGILHMWSLDLDVKELLNGSHDMAFANERAAGSGSLLALVQAVASAGFASPPGIWFVTRGAQPDAGHSNLCSPLCAPGWGLGRVVAQEIPELHCTLVDLDPAIDSAAANRLAEEILGSLGEEHSREQGLHENEIAFRHGERRVPRLIPAERSSPFGQVRLTIPVKGVLDNLVLEAVGQDAPGRGQVEIRVAAAGLNFRDVLNALGLYPGDAGPLGAECSGTISAIGPGVRRFSVGDNVVAIAAASFSSFALADERLVAFKPSTCDFNEAATMPVAFLTAWHGLHSLAELSAGQSVLIHSAAGGVGLAAVQIAQQKGARVFATCSNPKMPYLESIGVDRPLDSRTLHFADEIARRTGGCGVDVVLNSLPGDYIEKSLDLLAPGGVFIEIGKRDIWSAERVHEVRPDVRYFVFDLAELCREEPERVGAMLSMSIENFRPIPHTSFSIVDAALGFRFMAQSKHVGKVVILQPPASTLPLFRPDRAYLISGGLGSLGIPLLEWMADHGAHHLIAISRGAGSAIADGVIRKLAEKGAHLRVCNADIADMDGLSEVFGRELSSLPPLAGVFHLAGVLDDGTLPKQTPEKLENALRPKAYGAWNLHLLTREMSLDYFVLFSSVASVLGSPGQGNYAAANAFLDALAAYRRSLSLPALSINWGPFGGIGMAKAYRKPQHRASGIGSLSIELGMRSLGEFLQARDESRVVVAPIDIEVLLARFLEGPTPPLLRKLGANLGSRPSVSGPARESSFTEIWKAASPDRRRGLLVAHLREQVAAVIGLTSPRQLDLRQGFSSIGIDSLMAIELKTRLQTSFGLNLPNTLAFEYPNIEALANFFSSQLSERWHLNGNGNQPSIRSVQPDAIEDLSEDELASLLAKKLEVMSNSAEC